MISASQAGKARRLLEEDPIWGAYALADLEPPFAQDARWIIGRRALVLTYHGLQPPVLFATGDERELNSLGRQIPSGRYAYTLKADALAALGARISLESRVAMWRMALSAEVYRPARDERTRPLGPGDLAAIKRFMGRMDEAPDAFSPQQLESGVFFGLFAGEELLSMAGTHVVAPASGIAALGNVATLPQARRRGLARAASAAVIEAQLERGIHTLVLNVAQENRAALRLYLNLGFCIHCGYDEGVATLNPETIARSDP
jgi:ribosomal protein S18 acetylase RimI-like enzyme